MNIKKFTFNPFQENTFIVYDKSKECIIIDPGCYNKDEEIKLTNFIKDNKLNPVALLNTHCHIDHVLGNKYIADEFDLDLYINKKELPLLENVGETSKMYGLDNFSGPIYPKYFLEDGDVFEFGESSLKIFFTPGHSPGHICFYSKEYDFIISGDVIFKCNIGRTDLPFGDFKMLIASIKNKIMTLPKETKIYCGHGPDTILSFEKENNPYLVPFII